MKQNRQKPCYLGSHSIGERRDNRQKYSTLSDMYVSQFSLRSAGHIFPVQLGSYFLQTPCISFPWQAHFSEQPPPHLGQPLGGRWALFLYRKWGLSPHASLYIIIPDYFKGIKLNTNLSVKCNLWCLSWSRSLTMNVPEPSKYIWGRGGREGISTLALPLVQIAGLREVQLAGSYNTSDPHLRSTTGRLRKKFLKTNITGHQLTLSPK